MTKPQEITLIKARYQARVVESFLEKAEYALLELRELDVSPDSADRLRAAVVKIRERLSVEF